MRPRRTRRRWLREAAAARGSSTVASSRTISSRTGSASACRTAVSSIASSGGIARSGQMFDHCRNKRRGGRVPSFYDGRSISHRDGTNPGEERCRRQESCSQPSTAFIWGGQFVGRQDARSPDVDAFPLTTLRYALAAAAIAARSARRGRRAAARSDSTAAAGGCSVSARSASPASTCSPITGLAHARPQSAALIVALAPLVTALDPLASLRSPAGPCDRRRARASR